MADGSTKLDGILCKVSMEDKKARKSSLVSPPTTTGENGPKNNTNEPTRKISSSKRRRSTSSVISAVSSIRSVFKGRKGDNLTRSGGVDGESLKEVTCCANIDFTNLETSEKTQERIERYVQAEVFELYRSLDINGNEFLKADEIKCAFHFFGMDDVTLEEATFICEELSGQKGVDSVTPDEFAKTMHDAMTNGLQDSEVRMIFDVMDVHKQGHVGTPGVKYLFQKFGIQMEEQDAFDLIDVICKSSVGGKRYGLFDFEQFKHYVYRENKFDTTYGMLKNHYVQLIKDGL